MIAKVIQILKDTDHDPRTNPIEQIYFEVDPPYLGHKYLFVSQIIFHGMENIFSFFEDDDDSRYFDGGPETFIFEATEDCEIASNRELEGSVFEIITPRDLIKRLGYEVIE
jgi:hypothetical protein